MFSVIQSTGFPNEVGLKRVVSRTKWDEKGYFPNEVELKQERAARSGNLTSILSLKGLLTSNRLLLSHTSRFAVSHRHAVCMAERGAVRTVLKARQR